MLGLPVSTEVRKIIPKKKVFEHFASDMSAERRKSFDADVARITVCNEVSTVSLNLADRQGHPRLLCGAGQSAPEGF